MSIPIISSIMNVENSLGEAKKRKDGMPTVFWKVSRKPWLTIMLTEDWVKLYKMARGKTDGRTQDVCEEDH